METGNKLWSVEVNFKQLAFAQVDICRKYFLHVLDHKSRFTQYEVQFDDHKYDIHTDILAISWTEKP